MYLSSWSGGKDSCFACYSAIHMGYEISHLVNFVSEEYKRVSFHGIEARLIKLQSELAEIQLVQKETTPNGYEQEFKDTVQSLIPQDIKGMIFGDLYLEEQKQWVERVCGELEIETIEPLWKIDTEKIINDFINEGFEAIVVSSQKRFVGKEWIGHKVDREFLEYLKTKPDVDICGENGEYHTFVVGGPLFKGKIDITKSEIIERDGYWFLDIKDFKVVNRG